MTALILLAKFHETEIEIWRPVPNFPLYDVSNLGRVRSWRIQQALGGRVGSITTRRLTPKIIKPSERWAGRMGVSLCRDGKVFTRRIYRLVAEAFLPNANKLPQVNHKTGVHYDDRLGNLEWATRESDLAHAMRFGLTAHGLRSGHSKLTPDIVREIRVRYANGETQESIATVFGVTQANIGYIVRRKTWVRVE